MADWKCEDDLQELQEQMVVLDSAMHSVWLHGNWRYLTKQMTTEEKEATWAAVLRADERLKPDGIERLDPKGFKFWTWWRDD